MKSAITIILLVGVVSPCILVQRPIFAQDCKDEEAMVVDYQKDLSELVETTRKESLSGFEKSYHQKICLTKLGLSLSMVSELLDCLEKAAGNSTATKDQVDAYSSKRATYSKLKSKLEQNQKLLKAAADSKGAKSVMEKLDYSD